MPKPKELKRTFLQRIIDDFPNVFRCDDQILFYLKCDEEVSAEQYSQVTQHLKTKKHTQNVERKSKYGGNTSQALLTTIQKPENEDFKNFAMDLTRAFLNSNIPLHKITNPSIVGFIEKYTKFAAPTERTLRRNYVPALYDECINRMKEIAAGQKIWVSIDETTDCEQRYIANFVFGVLGQPDRCYLFAIKQLEATNSSTVATFFDESVNALGVPRTNVLLAATDAAPYMVCAMNGLKLLYPNMVHVTCLGHGLHRVADFIREQFKDVNDFVSNVEKIFRKVNSLNSHRSFVS